MKATTSLALAVLALVVVLASVASSLPAAPASASASANSPASVAPASATSSLTPSAITLGVTATLSTSEAAFFPGYATLWHNTTTENQTVPLAFPVNATVNPAGSSISTTLSVSSGVYVPVIEVYQGSTVLINASILGQVTVSAVAGSTDLSVKVEQLFTQAGAAVATGTYHVWVNASESVSLTSTTGLVWVQHPDSFNVTDTVTSAYGYWTNSSQVFVPFPAGGVTVNFTSAKAANATSVSVAYAGVYATNASLASGRSLTLTFSFVPVPVQTGAVLIPLTTPRLVAGTSASYAAFANWTNGGPLPYAGLYVLEIPSAFAYTPDPATVVVAVGSTVLNDTNPPYYHYQFKGKNLAKDEYSLEGSDVVLIPLALTVGVGSLEGFQVNLTSLFAPPSQSLVAGAVLLTYGAFALTWGQLLLAFMALPVMVAAFAPSLRRTERGMRTLAVDLTVASAAILALLTLSVLF